MSTTLRNLVVRVGADVSDLKSKMGQAEGYVGKFGSKVSKTGGKGGFAGAIVAGFAVAGTAVLNFAKDAAKAASEYADEVGLMAEKTGMSVKAAQEWKYVTEQLDTNYDSLITGTKAFTKQIAEVAKGNKDTIRLFAALGVTVRDSKNNIKPINDLFMETVGQMSKLKDETLKDLAAAEMFGKAYQDLAPILNSNQEELKQLLAKTSELGLVMTDEGIAAARAYGDQIDSLKAQMEGIKREMISGFLPAMIQGAKWLQDMLSGKAYTDQMQKKIKDQTEGLLGKSNPGSIDDFAKQFGLKQLAPPKKEKTGEELTGDLKKYFDDIAAKAEKTTDKMADSVREFADVFKAEFREIFNSINLFDKAQNNRALPLQRIINRLTGQVNQVKLFKDSLMKLKGKVSNELFQELASQGPESARQLALLANSDLSKVQQLFNKKMGISKEATAAVVGPQFGISAQDAWRNSQTIINVTGNWLFSDNVNKLTDEIVKQLKLKGVVPKK